MKRIKLSYVFAAALFSATLFMGKLTASDNVISVIPMNFPDRAIVQVTSPSMVSASVYIYDAEGTVLYADRISAESSTKLFDFSNLRDGVYTFESNSDNMNIIKKLGVKGDRVEILSKETEFKPVFSFDGNELKVNFLNQAQKDVEFSIENATSVFYKGDEGNDFTFHKKYDLSSLWLGDYYAKLKVGGKTYYHHFDVK